MSRRVLSLDWDYFTDDCSGWYTWKCCGFCPPKKRHPTAGKSSGRGLLENGGGSPHDPESVIRWVKRFGPLYVAECHASIVSLLKPGDRIWTLDAHFDCDPLRDGDWLKCGNWETVAYGGGCEVYHASIAAGGIAMSETGVPRTFDMTFLCQSSPWTPEDRDAEFVEIIRAISRRPRFCGHAKERLLTLYNTKESR